MRLIDADKVKFKFPYGIDHNGILMVPYKSCKCSLDNAPIVDAVPVVRCKECTHMRRDNVGVFCKVWHGYNGCGEDGFCNYGEEERTQPILYR